VYLTAGARHTLVDNFHRLVALDELAAGALALPAFELSAAAVNAHHEESTPCRSVADPRALKACSTR
jgi:hypothetical protein